MPQAPTTIPSTTRAFHLASRPVGEATAANFSLVTTDLPPLAAGQVLVRNTWMSVEPYMRTRMDEGGSSIPSFELGAPLDGGAVGEVIRSRADELPEGTTVSHFLGWREHAVVDAAAAEVVDLTVAPAQAYLGVLGTPGLTAWAALTDVAPVRPGDVVLVSSAAGAVGSVAGQMARRLGADRVIGIAGGPAKVARLATLGYDAGIDHKAGPLAEQLPEVVPEGVDVYVDAVGGDHLEAAIGSLRPEGRVALVGAIGQYNATAPVPGPTNLYDVIKKQASLRGLLVSTYVPRFPEYRAQVGKWLADGSLRSEETTVDGFDRAPQALIDLLRGTAVGKLNVRMG
jgi:NADPH-dependent curcumin reductase CurA